MQFVWIKSSSINIVRYFFFELFKCTMYRLINFKLQRFYSKNKRLFEKIYITKYQIAQLLSNQNTPESYSNHDRLYHVQQLGAFGKYLG